MNFLRQRHKSPKDRISRVTFSFWITGKFHNAAIWAAHHKSLKIKCLSFLSWQLNEYERENAIIFCKFKDCSVKPSMLDPIKQEYSWLGQALQTTSSGKGRQMMCLSTTTQVRVRLKGLNLIELWIQMNDLYLFQKPVSIPLWVRGPSRFPSVGQNLWHLLAGHAPQSPSLRAWPFEACTCQFFSSPGRHASSPRLWAALQPQNVFLKALGASYPPKM